MDDVPADNERDQARHVAVETRVLVARQLAAARRVDGSLDVDALVAGIAAYNATALEASRAQAARFGAVLENMVQGVCFFDSDQRLIVCNHRYAEIYGLKPEHVRPGTTLRDIVDQRYRAESTPAMTPSDYLRWRDGIAELQEPHTSMVELQNGRVIAIRHQPMPGGGWVATHEDITDQRAMERQLAFAEGHDAVTGLPKRAVLADQLREVLHRSSRASPCAVLSLSLEGLSVINDALGRRVGDDVLRIISERLRQHLRPADLLGQQDPNAFVIVQCEGAQAAEATRLAKQLLTLVTEPIPLNGEQMVVGASVGIATAFAAGLDADLLMRNANVALQWARTGVRGRYRLFEPEMDELAQARRLLEIDLHEAASGMAFQLHYQPQVDVQTRQVKGFEALLRWDHPVRGYIAPAQFIPVAEEIGLIGRIGQWVLEQACIDAASWPDGISVAVNVSALQLQGCELPGIVAAALHRSGLSPSRLELEITETCMVADNSAVSAMLQQLRASGVRIAMDDFGTGYSSLSALPTLPFDKIKIDRSFIAKLGHGPAHIAIIRAIVSLCASLGVTCVAEGVETEEQLTLLALANCAEAQGYLLGMPCPAQDVSGVLHRFALRPRRQSKPTSPFGPRVPAVGGSDQIDISFPAIVHTANDIIIVTSAELDPPGPTILYVNPAFTRLTGFEAHEAIGRSPCILQGPGTSRATLDKIAASLRAGQEVRQKVLNYAKCGAPYWLDLRIMPLRDSAGHVFQFVAIERDVTLDKRRLDELEYVADRDTLTGMPNRRALLRTMDAELQASRLRGGTGPCVAFIDVDHFKRVNDELGHAAGDAVLFGIADRLAENVRRLDMVGRIGGEEFVAWMPAITLREAAAIGERLQFAVAAEPFETPVGPVRVTVSIGVSAAESDEYSLADLMARADQAMYEAKRSGRNRVTTNPVMSLSTLVE